MEQTGADKMGKEPRTLSSLMEEWKVVVGAQMHFNDMLMRARSLAVTVVMGVFGAGAALLGQYPRKMLSTVWGEVHVSAVVVMFGLVLLVCVGLMDFFYYYKLLLGAVGKGEGIEKKMRELSGEADGAWLSEYLTGKVSRRAAGWIVGLYYLIPMITGAAFLVYLLCGYNP